MAQSAVRRLMISTWKTQALVLNFDGGDVPAVKRQKIKSRYAD